MARTSLQFHPTRQAWLICAPVIMVLPFTTSAMAVGRRMAASDRASASMPAASLQYGQATIYRSDEAPKSVTLPEPAAQPPAAPRQPPKGKESDELHSDLPVLIHGVPHRAALHYSRSVC